MDSEQDDFSVVMVRIVRLYHFLGFLTNSIKKLIR